jgi:hypothetical protein
LAEILVKGAPLVPVVARPDGLDAVQPLRFHSFLQRASCRASRIWMCYPTSCARAPAPPGTPAHTRAQKLTHQLVHQAVRTELVGRLGQVFDTQADSQDGTIADALTDGQISRSYYSPLK